MNNMDKNIARTITPSVVGAVAAWVVKEWAQLPANDLMYLTPLSTTIYYTAVRFLEEKYPKASWLLGALPVVPAAPAEKVETTVKVEATGTVTPPQA